jgi:hypothetical protein
VKQGGAQKGERIVREGAVDGRGRTALHASGDGSQTALTARLLESAERGRGPPWPGTGSAHRTLNHISRLLRGAFVVDTGSCSYRIQGPLHAVFSSIV